MNVISENDKHDTYHDIHDHTYIKFHSQSKSVDRHAGDHRHHRNQPQDHGKNTPVDIFSLWIIGCKKHAKQMDQQKQKRNSKNCQRLAAPAVGHIVLIKMCCDLLRQTVPQQDPCQ